MPFSVTFDKKALRAGAKKTLAVAQAFVREAPRKGCAAAEAHARSAHPYQDRTGGLTASIRSLSGYSSARSSSRHLVADAPARWLEYGTDPHVIRPKEGHGTVGPLQKGQSRRDLTDIGTHRIKLRWRDGNGWVFAYLVHHPGNKPYPFMWPAAEQARQVMVAQAYLAVRKMRKVWS